METLAAKKSFVVYYDMAAPINSLPDEEAGKLFKAILNHEDEPNLNPAADMAFRFITQQIDRDTQKYVARCKKNRENIQKRWDKEKTESAESNTTVYDRKESNTKRTDNVNENENENENENILLPAKSKKPKKETALSKLSKSDQNLYRDLKSFFLEQQPGKTFSNYPMQDTGIKGLIKKAKQQDSEQPEFFLKGMIATFQHLRQTDPFFKKQPFTPAGLNAGGIWDRVLVHAENIQSEYQGASVVDAAGLY